MRTLFYRIVYSPAVNWGLRGINRLVSPFTSFRLPPSGTLNLRLRSGHHVRLASNPTSHVSKVLYYDGPDAFEYTAIFTRLIQRCNTFIDVGANTGYYSVLAATIQPEIKVIAVEPAPGPLHYLNKNVVLNHAEGSIEVAAIALSDHEGTVTFQPAFNPKYAFIPHHLGGTGHAVAEGSGITVKADTLDHFLAGRTVDLIKMDTEGTEDQILRGSVQTIQTHRPIIICEVLFNKIEAALEAIMQSHGYTFYNHLNGKLHKVESIHRRTDDGVRDCFFVPKEKLKWIEEFVNPGHSIK